MGESKEESKTNVIVTPHTPDTYDDNPMEVPTPVQNMFTQAPMNTIQHTEFISDPVAFSKANS